MPLPLENPAPVAAYSIITINSETARVWQEEHTILD
jgi:hypothetical protein